MIQSVAQSIAYEETITLLSLLSLCVITPLLRVYKYFYFSSIFYIFEHSSRYLGGLSRSYFQIIQSTLEAMPDKHKERAELTFQTTLSTVERLIRIQAKLIQTNGIDFNLSVVNDGIKKAIRELDSSTKGRDWNSIGELALLDEVERMVGFRKVLVESGFPHGSELQGLGDIINLAIRYVQWE